MHIETSMTDNAGVLMSISASKVLDARQKVGGRIAHTTNYVHVILLGTLTPFPMHSEIQKY